MIHSWTTGLPWSEEFYSFLLSFAFCFQIVFITILLAASAMLESFPTSWISAQIRASNQCLCLTNNSECWRPLTGLFYSPALTMAHPELINWIIVSHPKHSDFEAFFVTLTIDQLGCPCEQIEPWWPASCMIVSFYIQDTLTLVHMNRDWAYRGFSIGPIPEMTIEWAWVQGVFQSTSDSKQDNSNR